MYILRPYTWGEIMLIIFLLNTCDKNLNACIMPEYLYKIVRGKNEIIRVYNGGQ